MITKSFHDIYDLVEFVGMLKDANITINFEDGVMRFSITNASDHDANGMPRKYEYVTLDGSSTTIDGYLENIEKAYNYVGQKIASGEWEKAEVPA
jgi:hypothetical protein